MKFKQYAGVDTLQQHALPHGQEIRHFMSLLLR